MSVWLGGLGVARADRCSTAIPTPGARPTTSRRVALWSVIVIVATGVFATWREVGWSLDAFFHTTYGRLLLVKIAVFIGLLALAAWSRHIVRARRPAALSAAVATETAAARDGVGARRRIPTFATCGGRWARELLFGIAVLVDHLDARERAARAFRARVAVLDRDPRRRRC